MLRPTHRGGSRTGDLPAGAPPGAGVATWWVAMYFSRAPGGIGPPRSSCCCCVSVDGPFGWWLHPARANKPALKAIVITSCSEGLGRRASLRFVMVEQFKIASSFELQLGREAPRPCDRVKHGWPSTCWACRRSLQCHIPRRSTSCCRLWSWARLPPGASLSRGHRRRRSWIGRCGGR